MTDTPTQTRIDVAIMATDLAYIRTKIDQVCSDFTAQDQRLDKVEKVIWAITGVSSLLAAILVPVAVAAVRKWLGL